MELGKNLRVCLDQPYPDFTVLVDEYGFNYVEHAGERVGPVRSWQLEWIVSDWDKLVIKEPVA